jgi:hypothetical protein
MVEAMSGDSYQAYLARFEHEVGAHAVGAYVKWQGRLIRKLTPEEFASKHGEFVRLQDHYLGGLERGDTLNDVVTRLLREHRAELLLPADEIPL